MKTATLLFICFSFSVLFSFAQFIPEKIFTDPAGVYGFRNVATVSDGHIGALGYTQGYGYYNRNFTVANFDRSFSFKWAKGYGNNTVCHFEVNDILELSDNGYVVIGTQQDSITNANKSIMVRLDSTGNILFAHDLIDTIHLNAIEPQGLLGNTDSTFVLFNNLWTDGSVSVSKVDYAGNILKTTMYRSYWSVHTATYATSSRRANGDYVLILRSSNIQGSMLVCLQFDQDLNLISNNSYDLGTPVFCYDVAEDPADQSLILVAWLSSSPYLQPLLIKLDASANLIWSKAITPSLSISGIGSVLIKDNRYYFSGTNGYTIDHIPFVMVTDTSGVILNSETYTHLGQATGFNSMIDMQDSMMILIYGTLNSHNGPGYIVIDSSLYSACSNDDITFSAAPFAWSTNQDLYVDSVPIGFIDVTSEYQTMSFALTENDYCLSNSIRDVESNEGTMLLSTTGKNLTIMMSNYSMYKNFSIYSSSGQLIRKLKVEGRSTIADLTALSKGIYIIKAEGEGAGIARKFVFVD